MGRIVVIEHLTLDGVMQAPGGADEDPRDGFAHGGWATARCQDPLLRQAMGARMSTAWALLAGRTTYEQFADHWPRQAPNPFTEALTKVTKYVVSDTVTEPLPWENSVRVHGDAAAGLKRDVPENLIVLGSGVLARSLLTQGLVDELLLMVHPLVLGSGRRLFHDRAVPAFTLTEVSRTDGGVIVAAYAVTG